MNKKTIIIGIAVVVLLGAIGGAIMMNKKKAPASSVGVVKTTPSVPGTSSVEENEAQTVESKSFNEILSSGATVECTFSDNVDATTKTAGVIYANGLKMRGDFQVQEGNNPTMTGHMIMRDGYMYSWMENTPAGIKVSLDATKAADASNDTAVDVDSKVDMRCKPWSDNPMMFNLPDNRQFQDMTPMMGQTNIETQGNAGASTDADTKAIQCAGCDTLPQEQKAQCKTVLGCQ